MVEVFIIFFVILLGWDVFVLVYFFWINLVIDIFLVIVFGVELVELGVMIYKFCGC